MSKKRYRANVVQLADQIASSADLSLGSLPPPPEAISLVVTIRPNGNSYHCDILEFPHVSGSPMSWRWADFESELDGLAPFARMLSVPGEIAPATLQEIAARGKILFEAVFPSAEAQDKIRGACNGAGGVEILFYTDQFALFWPLL